MITLRDRIKAITGPLYPPSKLDALEGLVGGTESVDKIAGILEEWAREHFCDGMDAAADRNIGVDRSAEDVAREVIAGMQKK